MIEEKLDIWDAYDAGAIVCITTNGFVKGNGEAVMGRGVARQAVWRWPYLPRMLGQLLSTYGNHVRILVDRLLAFPVKGESGINTGENVVTHMSRKFRPGSWVPGWALKADLEIIARSLQELDRQRQIRGWN